LLAIFGDARGFVLMVELDQLKALYEEEESEAA